MLKQRVITALILAALVLVALFSKQIIYWRVLINLVIFIGFWEWLRFCKINELFSQLAAYTVFILCVWCLQAGLLPMTTLLVAVCLCWLLLFWFTLSDSLNFLHQSFVKLVIGIIVLSTAGFYVIEIKQLENGQIWILGLLISVFAADIGAYFVGRRFGETKLAERISPNKTVEGVLGGLAFALILAAPIVFQFFDYRAALLLLLIAVITVLTSVLGDLFISKQKRFAGLKDSSQILPGHGGILDRIDSLLSAAPFYSLGLVLLGHWH